VLLDITTLNTDKERDNKTFYLIIILYCLGMPVFVNHRVVIAKTFAEKHFWQIESTRINSTFFD
jgi:hypothetical protein